MRVLAVFFLRELLLHHVLECIYETKLWLDVHVSEIEESMIEEVGLVVAGDGCVSSSWRCYRTAVGVWCMVVETELVQGNYC